MEVLLERDWGLPSKNLDIPLYRGKCLMEIETLFLIENYTLTFSSCEWEQ